ncbi:MAG: nucleotidyltransferase [Anaerolineaceae bacterium]|nr:nucleotidyltransferase [Anaerolineaceae bacterium]
MPPTLEDLRQRRDEIMALMERYGAYNVRVFGSVARGDAGPDSDVDLLVNLTDGKSMFDLVGLWLDLQELLGREVSLLTEHDRMRERLRINIMRDAVAL